MRGNKVYNKHIWTVNFFVGTKKNHRASGNVTKVLIILNVWKYA